MEYQEKISYTPEEFAEYANIISNFVVKKFQLCNSGGTLELQMHAREFIEEIENYKKIPKNLQSAIGLDINKIEEQCKQYI